MTGYLTFLTQDCLRYKDRKYGPLQYLRQYLLALKYFVLNLETAG